MISAQIFGITFTLLLANGSLSAQKVTGRLISPLYVQERLTVVPEMFTEGNIRTIASSFVNRFRRVPVASLYIESEVERYGYYSNKGIDHSSFANWHYRVLRAMEDGELPIARIAEVNILSGQAVLRMRINDHVGRVVLTERDPFFLRIGNKRYEILEIVARYDGTVAGRSFVSCDTCLTEFEVFVKSEDRVSLNQACAVAAFLEAPVKPLMVNVDLRKDHFFVTSPLFPMFYGFDSSPRIPTAEQFRLSPEAYCLGSENQSGVLPKR